MTQFAPKRGRLAATPISEKGSFEPIPSSVHRAREFARLTLQRWHIDKNADVVVLLVSELATNAVVHAKTRYEVELVRERVSVAVRVSDMSNAEPRRSPMQAPSPNGRGLAIVGELAEWGYDVHENHGKTVWAQVKV